MSSEIPQPILTAATSKFRLYAGLSCIGMSYLLCWPLIAFFSMLSMRLNDPIYITIGGPGAYIFSHLLFILGAYLAGAKYTKALVKWATHKLKARFTSSTAISGSDPCRRL